MPEIPAASTLSASALSALPGIRHAFFTRGRGNPSLSQPDRANALAVRGAMAAELGTDTDYLISPHQTHSAIAVTVTDPWPLFDNPEGDALVTGRPGLALGIGTADCVPVLFADPVARVIAAAHAGWPGAYGGIVENTLAAMETIGAKRARIVAALGPCICQPSYEVGPEFHARFLAQATGNDRFFIASARADHFMFDLPGYVMQRLRDGGVVSVTASPADTCADPARFFSHRYSTLRGEKRDGNQLSVIMLAEA